MDSTNQNTPFRDPLYQLGRNAIRQANASVLPHMLKKLQNKISSKSASGYMEAEFRILAAEIARSLGDEKLAASFLDVVIENPPAVGVDLLSRAQRLRVSLYLDEGNVQSAANMAEVIDAHVIENSELGSQDIISRNDENISVETLLLMAEVALYSSEQVAAGEVLILAAKRLSEMESRDAKKKLSAFETQQKTLYCTELRYKLHLWRAVLRIVAGDEEGFTLLRDLADDLAADTKSDRRIMARVRALLGDFDIDNSAAPPAGLSRKEAMRLFALCSRSVFDSIIFPEDDEILQLEAKTEVPSGSNLPAKQLIELSVTSPIVVKSADGDHSAAMLARIFENQNSTNERIATVFERMTEALEKLPVQSAEQNLSQQNKRPFAFGGGFAFFDLVTQLGNAEISKFTGYFQVQWSPDMVESSVLAKNLDPLARAGEGFIFVQNGFIVDAPIKDYDPPEEFQAGTAKAEADARRSLTVMIQVGIGQKLDCLPDGFGSFYRSQAVAERKPRLKYNQFQIAVLIQERDEELQ